MNSLEQKIRGAFPEAFSCAPISHEDCVDLRLRIISATHEYFQCTFGQVLLDLLKTHAAEPKDADEFISFLDVDQPPFEGLPRSDPEEEREIDQELRNAKKRNLDKLTPSQAQVLIDFLTTAKDWEALFRKEQADSALNYWRQRTNARQVH